VEINDYNLILTLNCIENILLYGGEGRGGTVVAWLTLDVEDDSVLEIDILICAKLSVKKAVNELARVMA